MPEKSTSACVGLGQKQTLRQGFERTSFTWAVKKTTVGYRCGPLESIVWGGNSESQSRPDTSEYIPQGVSLLGVSMPTPSVTFEGSS